MDNAIPPVTLPSLGGYPADSGVAGTVDSPSSEALKPGIGENVELQILPQDDNADFSKLSVKLKINLTNKLIEIPVTLNLNKNLDLAADQIYDAVAKVVAKTPQRLELKLVSINNEKPENYVLNVSNEIFETEKNAQQSQLPPSADKTLFSRLTATLKMTPVLMEKVAQSQNSVSAPNPAEITGTGDKNLPLSDVKLLPVKLSSVLEQNLIAANVPPAAAKQAARVFANINLELQIIPKPTMANLSEPPLNLSSLVNVIKESLSQSDSSGQMLNRPALENKVAVELSQIFRQPILGEIKTMDTKSWPLIQTILGDVVPEIALKIPPETKLMLKIKSIIHHGEHQQTASSMGLKEALSSLNHQNLQPLQELLMAKIPQNNEKMLANVLSFIKAAHHQKIEQWLGTDLVEQLRAKGPEGQEAIEKFSSLLTTKTAEQNSWRIIEVPFFGDGSLNKIRVAVKKMQDEENQKDQSQRHKSAVRFVVDTSFSQLGDFQFDGFSFVNDKRFDLIVRTQKDLGDDFCANVMRIFKNSLSEVDYVGSLKVNVKENFIKLCEDTSKGTTLENGIFI